MKILKFLTAFIVLSLQIVASAQSPATSPKSLMAQKIAGATNFQGIDNDKSGKVKSKLGKITISDDNLFVKLKIKNRSTLNFDIDFIRFYVRDLKTASRTVTQEQEIYPVSSYGPEQETVAGKSSEVYVFALKKFPLAKDKALFIEVYERNGGRHQYLKAKQTDIENADPIK
ncbi:DUF4138 domain-containing protein [Pedobacter sp. P351]|uniref:DUF4138 domain-containing protein n=1 Tax=Pedobacter superstes TaxID=3133441 RepID=UPI0030A06134